MRGGGKASPLWKDRIDFVTVMAAADERIHKLRHPVPSDTPIQTYFMLSLNPRKWGLIVSLTGFVHSGKVPRELRAKYEVNVHVDCAFMAATRPGIQAREVLSRSIRAYGELGYPEGWRLHHQGGATGYTGRCHRTDLETHGMVMGNQAFTWDPSMPGTKTRIPSWGPMEVGL